MKNFGKKMETLQRYQIEKGNHRNRQRMREQEKQKNAVQRRHQGGKDGRENETGVQFNSLIWA